MNLLERLFHEQHTVDGEPVVFRCRECGYQSVSLGQLHGHAEQHRELAIDPFGLVVPPWRWGDAEALMAFTEIYAGGERVSWEAVDGE